MGLCPVSYLVKLLLKWKWPTHKQPISQTICVTFYMYIRCLVYNSIFLSSSSQFTSSPVCLGFQRHKLDLRLLIWLGRGRRDICTAILSNMQPCSLASRHTLESSQYMSNRQLALLVLTGLFHSESYQLIRIYDSCTWVQQVWSEVYTDAMMWSTLDGVTRRPITFHGWSFLAWYLSLPDGEYTHNPIIPSQNDM